MDMVRLLQNPNLPIPLAVLITPGQLWRFSDYCRGRSGPLVNWFSAFSDEPSLKVAKLLYRREICLLRNQSVQIGQSLLGGRLPTNW